jgi:hypothetical protein
VASLYFVVLQWQNSHGFKSGKKQAGYGIQSHNSVADMDATQQLSSDAKVYQL